MIDIQKQEEMLIAIGNILSKKIEVYAIGGTAMMLRGIKKSTLDVDFVFDKKEDREEFMIALRKLGAEGYDATLVYGFKKDSPLMLKFNDCRFDMFMNKIITSYFSSTMKERAKEIHEFGNLIVKVADANDILIMKSATSREKDDEDIIALISKSKIDWNVVLEEAKEQFNLGNQGAIFYLGEKLEKLVNVGLIKVPKEVLDNIVKMHNKQIKSKVKKEK